MAKILIVYDTEYGNTQKMAVAAMNGVQSVEGATATLKSVEEVTTEDFTSHDGFLFGSPVHMGSPGWKMKKMIDTVCSKLWMKDAVVGKVAGVFVSGGGFGSAGGGCELTLLAMLNNIAELGLIIVPLPKNTPGYKDGGIQWGPYGKSMGPSMEQIGVLPEGLIAVMHHGAHVARVTNELKGKKLFSN